MSKILEKISGLTVLLLGLVSVVLVTLIYVGGNDTPLMVGEDTLTNPTFTNPLLYWSYFLLVLTLGITVLFTLIGFIKKLAENPTNALKSLIPLVLFALVFVVSWFLGSGEQVAIIGYEGTENQGFWAQFSDMIIYSIYALFIGLAITIVGAGIYRKYK